MPEDKTKEQEIDDLRKQALDVMLGKGFMDRNVSGLLIHDIHQLNETTKDAAATTNKLTGKIKTLNLILVILGSAAVLIGLANLVWMIYTSCIK
jgi:hypothetical protein